MCNETVGLRRNPKVRISRRVLPRSFPVSSHVPDSNPSLLPLTSHAHCGAPCPICVFARDGDNLHNSKANVSAMAFCGKTVNYSGRQLRVLSLSSFGMFEKLPYQLLIVQNRRCFPGCLLWACAAWNYRDLAGWQHLPVSRFLGVVLSS